MKPIPESGRIWGNACDPPAGYRFLSGPGCDILWITRDAADVTEHPSREQQMGRLDALDGNRHLLDQAARLLGKLDDDTYAGGGAGPGISPVGMHVRHVLDHYRSLLDGLATGLVDYEARHRDAPVERDRSLALAMTRQILADLSRLDGQPADRPLTVNLQSVIETEAADWSHSTLKRELQFLVSHTVHHFALIRALLRDTGFEPEEAFGFAPSTVAARQRETACAS